MTDDELLDQFKLHVELDSDADTTMLNGYLRYARRFVKTATGKETDQMVLMVAALLYDFRVSDKELGEGLESLTPFLLSEVFADDEANESTQTQS